MINLIDLIDPPPKPCLRRINHDNVSRFETSTTWCLQPDGHQGACLGPLPSILEPEPRRRPRWG